MTKKVLVTGANGQLGQQFVQFKQHDYSIIGLSRAELDITSEQQCQNAIIRYKPDVIIHCSAYTAVDLAESNKDAAFLVNEQGTLNMVKAAAAQEIPFVYISTDYVFNGDKGIPYVEEDITDPKTAYGASKLAGEKAVIANHTRYFIVRTSWVFGKYGHNFVKTMLKLSEQQKMLQVINDQYGSPTYTYDLVHFIFQLIATEKYGIYHATNADSCTWYEFAKAIFEINNRDVNLMPCTTEQFLRPAKRPAYSVLENRKLVQEGFEMLRPWQDALRHMFAKQDEI